LKEYYQQVLLKEIGKAFFPDLKAVEFFLAQERAESGKIKPENFIDTRFLAKLKKEGYF
jgi:hypothetical protein